MRLLRLLLCVLLMSTLALAQGQGTGGGPSGGSGGGTTTNALTFNNGGSGAASGATFDGSVAQTVSTNTIGALPANGATSTGSGASNVVMFPGTLSAGTSVTAPSVVSTATTGTPPFTVSSTTVVPNLHVASSDALSATSGLPAAAKVRSVSAAIGETGTAATALTAGTQIIHTARNSTGAMLTLTAVYCLQDAGASTVAVADSSGNQLLSATTQTPAAGTTFTALTLNGTPTLASGASLIWTFTADGTSKEVSYQADWTL